MRTYILRTAKLVALALLAPACWDDPWYGPWDSSAFTSKPPLTATVGELYTYAVTLADPADDFYMVQYPRGAFLNTQSNVIYWTPGPEYANVYEHFSISTYADLFGGYSTQSWSVHVFPADSRIKRG